MTGCPTAPLADTDYRKQVRDLVDDYLSRTPGPVALPFLPRPLIGLLLAFTQLSLLVHRPRRLRPAALIQATSARLPEPHPSNFIRGGRVVWRAGAQDPNGGGAEAASGV
jgi:hypothetical protein